MRLLRRIVNTIERGLDEVMLGLFLVMVCAIVWQVFARYVLGSATAWAEELSMFLLAWITMSGGALVIRGEGHVAVTLFVDALPQFLRRLVEVVRNALTIALMGALVLYGYRLCVIGMRQTAPGTDIPMSIPYLSIPVGALLIAVFLAIGRDDPGQHLRATEKD